MENIDIAVFDQFTVPNMSERKNRFYTGDKFVDRQNLPFQIVQLFKDGCGKYAMVAMAHKSSYEIIPLHELCSLIQKKEVRQVRDPKYKIGNKFIKGQGNLASVNTILGVSPSVDFNNESYMYFVERENNAGNVSYSTISESKIDLLSRQSTGLTF